MYLERLDEKQQDLILRHLELVVEANKTTNLTRIDDWDEAVMLHVEDSLAALEEVSEAFGLAVVFAFDFCTQMQELVVALRRGIVVREVEKGL